MIASFPKKTLTSKGTGGCKVSSSDRSGSSLGPVVGLGL